MRSKPRVALTCKSLAGCLIFLLAVFVDPAVSRSSADSEASAFIEGLANKAVAALTDPKISREERKTRAKALLEENFAVETIGRFVLGRYWQQATPAQQKEYLSLFKELIVSTYIDRFAQYSGEKLNVIRSVPSEGGSDVMVSSQINRTNGAPVEVGWRVRKVGANYKIVDVVVEGVSMGQTQRSEFASVIRNSGGKVEGLLDEMRRRIQQAA